jgi:hypothetical protein
MKKALLLSALVVACVFSANAQHKRRVLVEEFTNASCPPCAAQNPTFNALLDANADKVTPVKYQAPFPGADPMNAQNPSEVSNRLNYYAIGGVPTGVVNGTYIADDCNAYDGCPVCLSADEIDATYNNLTPVTMNLTYALTPDYDSILISVTVTSDAALTGDLRLHVAVLEEAIYFATAAGSNGEKEFFQPMRKMLPNANGTTTGDFTAGETKTYTMAWPIPAYIYNENQLGVSAWLQNNTSKEVFQSFRAEPTTPKVQIPSSSTFVCSPGSSPSFELINLANAPLTSATIRYRVGGANGTWEDYNWTGNVPAGGSTVVTLSNVVINNTGNNSLDLLAVTSNNGSLQTNLNLGFGTINVKGLFDPGAALPFDYGFQATTFPPTGWNVENSGSNGWKLAITAGAGSTRSAKNNMFDYPGETTTMMTPKLDLSSVSGTTLLTFDHAYTWYDALNFDSLRVELSADCGATWTTVFHNGYEGLATAPASTGAFTPNASQWAPNEIDISAFNGSSEVFVRFAAESGFGNNLYIDNVNLKTSVGVKNLDLTSFAVMPNPASDKSEVRFGLTSAQNVQLLVFNTLGALVQSRDLGELTSGDHTVALTTLGLNSGSYRVVLQGEEGTAQTQWVIMK